MTHTQLQKQEEEELQPPLPPAERPHSMNKGRNLLLLQKEEGIPVRGSVISTGTWTD